MHAVLCEHENRAQILLRKKAAANRRKNFAISFILHLFQTHYSCLPLCSLSPRGWCRFSASSATMPKYFLSCHGSVICHGNSIPMYAARVYGIGCGLLIYLSITLVRSELVQCEMDVIALHFISVSMTTYADPCRTHGSSIRQPSY